MKEQTKLSQGEAQHVAKDMERWRELIVTGCVSYRGQR